MSLTEPAALEVRDLLVQFGGVTAVDRVSLRVARGARHGILGPNGSGKTTLFNAITGLFRPRSGQILLNDIDITRTKAHQRSRLGLARTFQITSLFPSLTAHQNVAMAALVRTGRDRDPWNAATSQESASDIARATLNDLGLTRFGDRLVQSLGYGEQRQLEIAVALAAAPAILLLDEPTAGLSASETANVGELIRRLPSDLTIVLIEHDLHVVFDLTNHLTVLQNGKRIADGETSRVRTDPVVKAVYLGD